MSAMVIIIGNFTIRFSNMNDYISEYLGIAYDMFES